jgi:cytidine deaminase
MEEGFEFTLNDFEKVSQMTSFELSLDELSLLVENGLKAKENSYSPYSKFRVGTALLTSSGKIYLGTNVENLTYGLTICSERSATCNAVVNGEREFKAALVTTDMEYFVTPCGPCRQTLKEFNVKYCLLLTKDSKLAIYTVEFLLPDGPKIHHLKK